MYPVNRIFIYVRKNGTFLAPFFVHDAMVNPILTNVNIPIIF